MTFCLSEMDMGLGWCFSSLLRVPREPLCNSGMPQQVPKPWLCCHCLTPQQHLQCCIPAVAGGAFWLPSLVPPGLSRAQADVSQAPPLHPDGLAEPPLGHECPSHRQLLLMDGSCRRHIPVSLCSL